MYPIDTKEDLIKNHFTLVKRIAHHMTARLPDSVQIDDLMQAGMIGLMEAAKNFKVSGGASFETFAGIRIRGAMIDEIRRGDWVPRSVHRNSRLIADTIAAIEQETGTDAKDSDVAEKLGISLDEYHKMLRDANNGFMLGFDDLGISEEQFDEGLSSKPRTPLEFLESSAFKANLIDAIDSLPEKEKLVLSLYYDEELNLKEIGQVLGVSESRVSQINSQAMVRLKSRLKHWAAEPV
ncbi:MAG: RNA polymerase sigma factor FliA [Pseudomonadota bacterium]